MYRLRHGCFVSQAFIIILCPEADQNEILPIIIVAQRRRNLTRDCRNALPDLCSAATTGQIGYDLILIVQNFSSVHVLGNMFFFWYTKEQFIWITDISHRTLVDPHTRPGDVQDVSVQGFDQVERTGKEAQISSQILYFISTFAPRAGYFSC